MAGTMTSIVPAMELVGQVRAGFDPIGRQPGQRVTVTPDDTGRDPVVGELVA